jgi:hypothetical protein
MALCAVVFSFTAARAQAGTVISPPIIITMPPQKDRPPRIGPRLPPIVPPLYLDGPVKTGTFTGKVIGY